MSVKTRNHYNVLEISPLASTEVIHGAWRELSKKLGDTHPGRRLLNEAYEVLSDANKRKAYDESLNPVKGKRIGNYRITELIGEGGFGETYLAEHIHLRERACIKKSHKISTADEDVIMQEAKAMWNFRHYGIPAMRDIIRLDDGNVAIVMSYIEGRNLQKIVEEDGPMEPEDLCICAERVLNCLLYVDDHNGVHGDIKPANIIYDKKTHRAFVVDWGLATINPNRNSTYKGYTKMFASPEQIGNGIPCAENDLYSLGLTMIFALGGDVKSHWIPPSVPIPLRKFIERLIVRDINQRPNWKKGENLCQTMSDVRYAAFKRRSSS